MTLIKGQVKYLCAAGHFEKQVKAELSNVSYTFLQELWWLKFGKPMLMYDQKIEKFFFNHVYRSLSLI